MTYEALQLIAIRQGGDHLTAYNYNDERRARYASDGGYRAKRIKRSRRYYRKHADAVNERRRTRYKDDDRRALVLAQNQTYRAKVAAGHVPSPAPLHALVKGLRVRVYRVSETARLLGCVDNTINRWIDHGWIPEPHYDQRRLFTTEQVELMALFYSVPQHMHRQRSKVSAKIFRDWWK